MLQWNVVMALKTGISLQDLHCRKVGGLGQHRARETVPALGLAGSTLHGSGRCPDVIMAARVLRQRSGGGRNTLITVCCLPNWSRFGVFGDMATGKTWLQCWNPRQTQEWAGLRGNRAKKNANHQVPELGWATR